MQDETPAEEPGAVPSRHRRILDAATVAFHEKGFHGVGVDEIGARAGLSGPSLYRHFAGKHQILATLLDEAMDELTTATTPATVPAGTAPVDAGQALDAALRHHVAFALAHRPLVGLYQREVRSLADPWATAFHRRARAYTRSWEQLVARRFPARGAGRVAADTQACLGLVFSVTAWPERVLAEPDLAETLLDLLDRLLGNADPDHA